jgi:hypothetical protein
MVGSSIVRNGPDVGTSCAGSVVNVTAVCGRCGHSQIVQSKTPMVPVNLLNEERRLRRELAQAIVSHREKIEQVGGEKHAADRCLWELAEGLLK